MASIRCGNCGETHGSVAEVRACASKGTPFENTNRIAAEKAKPPTDTRKREPAAEGFYHKDGEFYKVQVAHHGSGRRYAKVARQDFGSDRVVWEYVRGVVYDLGEEHKVSPEQAAKFGELYGRCIRCGRVLTAEESIERAMGPVCSGKMGW